MRAIVEHPADLGRFVRRIRTDAGLSQTDLAGRLGVSQRYVSELESGKPKRIDEHYLRILAALGIVLTAESNDA